MTVFELVDRIKEDELMLWTAEDILRAEDRRHEAMLARVKVLANG